MPENEKFLDSDDLKPVAGEIDCDPSDTLKGLAIPVDIMVEDEIVMADIVSGTADSHIEPSVVTDEPGVIRQNVRSITLCSRMTVNEREVVKNQIEDVIFKRLVRGLEEIVDILSEFMPTGIRKPKLCNGDPRHNICCRFEKDLLDIEEVTINFRVKGMDCKIIVEDDGVEMYVSIGPKYVLYCK